MFRLHAPDIAVAPLICFEDTLGRAGAEPVLHGAQLLVNITNDVWFGHTAAADAATRRGGLPHGGKPPAAGALREHGRHRVRGHDGPRDEHPARTRDGSIFGAGVLWGEVKVPGSRR